MRVTVCGKMDDGNHEYIHSSNPIVRSLLSCATPCSHRGFANRSAPSAQAVQLPFVARCVTVPKQLRKSTQPQGSERNSKLSGETPPPQSAADRS